MKRLVLEFGSSSSSCDHFEEMNQSLGVVDHHQQQHQHLFSSPNGLFNCSSSQHTNNISSRSLPTTLSRDSSLKLAFDDTLRNFPISQNAFTTTGRNENSNYNNDHQNQASRNQSALSLDDEDFDYESLLWAPMLPEC